MGWNSYFDAPLLQQLLFAQGLPGANVVTNNSYSLFPAAGGNAAFNLALGTAQGIQLDFDCFPNVASSVDESLLNIRVRFYRDITGTTVMESMRHGIFVQTGSSSTDNFGFTLRMPCFSPFIGIDVTCPASTGAEVDVFVTTTSRQVVPLIYRGAPSNLQVAPATTFLVQAGSRGLGQYIDIGGSGPGNFAAGQQIAFYPAFYGGTECFMQALTNTTLVGAGTVDFTLLSYPLGGTGGNRVGTVRLQPGATATSNPVTTEYFIPPEACKVLGFNGSTAPAGIECAITQHAA